MTRHGRPLNADPHSFEQAPEDQRRVASSLRVHAHVHVSWTSRKQNENQNQQQQPTKQNTKRHEAQPGGDEYAPFRTERAVVETGDGSGSVMLRVASSGERIEYPASESADTIIKSVTIAKRPVCDLPPVICWTVTIRSTLFHSKVFSRKIIPLLAKEHATQQLVAILLPTWTSPPFLHV